MSRYKQPYTIFKRGKYWYYRTYTEDGIRTTAKTTGKTSKTAAKDYCEALYLDDNLIHKKILFANYAKDFFKPDSPFILDRATQLQSNTINGYQIRLDSVIMPYFKNMELSDINYSILKKFRIEVSQKYSYSYTTGIMNVLNIIIKTAYRDRIIKSNPFDFLEQFKKPNAIGRDAFTLEEIKALYAKIEDEEFKRLYLLLVLTGCRISEAVGLTSEDVKFKGNIKYLDIKRQFYKNEYKPCKVHSYREMPIIPEIENLLNFTKKRLGAFYKKIVPENKNIDDAENRNLCFHSIRHFYITNTKAFGIPDIKVEYLAGHKLPGVKGVYTNFKAEDVIEIKEWQKTIYYELINLR